VLLSVGEDRRSVRHPNEAGWRDDTVTTVPGKVANVRLDITTPHDGARHFCVWLEVDG
jgi:hypothetical protein